MPKNETVKMVDKIKLYSEKILELAPCTKEFTKSEVLRHIENEDYLEFEKYIEQIYDELLKNDLIEQSKNHTHPNCIKLTQKGIDKKFAGYDYEEFTINRILNELYKTPNKRKFYTDILDENHETYDYVKGAEMSKLLLQENLIIWVEKSEVWLLSPKGRRVVREGGWIEKIESKKIRKKSEKNLKYYQYADAKFRYYAFWPIFLFALIGGIYSCVKIIEWATAPKSIVNVELKK